MYTCKGVIDASVSVCIYGDKGKTDDILLNNFGDKGKTKSNNFEEGKLNTFRNIKTAKIGNPYKLRVWSDNKDISAGWKLEKIVAENMDTKE